MKCKNMFKIKEINTRFLSFFPEKTQQEIAANLGVSRSTVSQWAIGIRQVPWDKLKKARDVQNISWDWLLEGTGDKTRAVCLDIEAEQGHFNTPGINQRFLSLFSNKTQDEVAASLGVTQSAVSSWKTFVKQVPWNKLKMAVDRQRITWEWLLEGRGPKFR